MALEPVTVMFITIEVADAGIPLNPATVRTPEPYQPMGPYHPVPIRESTARTGEIGWKVTPGMACGVAMAAGEAGLVPAAFVAVTANE